MSEDSRITQNHRPTSQPRAASKSPLLYVTGVTDHTCVGRIFAVYRCIRVTFSYVSDLALLVHFPVEHRHTIPRHLHSRALRRAPYNDSIKLPSFRRPLFHHHDATRPVAVAGRITLDVRRPTFPSYSPLHVEYLSCIVSLCV